MRISAPFDSSTAVFSVSDEHFTNSVHFTQIQPPPWVSLSKG